MNTLIRYQLSFLGPFTVLLLSLQTCLEYDQYSPREHRSARGLISVEANNDRTFYRRERIAWCTISVYEQKKCQDWSRAIEEVNGQASFGQEPLEFNLDCVQASDKDQCMSYIDDERADLILLDPGEIGVAGRYHSLSPIMAERYGPGRSEAGHYSVAIVKKRSSFIQTLDDLFGKKACFSGVSHMASWTLPLASLIDLPSFIISDCNNLVKSASYFFGNSCAPNALINKFNPKGDNPQKMSYLCERRDARVGAHYDPYNGVYGTLKCLNDLSMVARDTARRYPHTDSSPMLPLSDLKYKTDFNRGGDVAFVRHNTVQLSERLLLTPEQRAEVPSRADIELLCPQGGRQSLDNWQNCNFGFSPAHAVVVSSRVPTEKREQIQRFLKRSVQLFSSPFTPVSGGSSASAIATAGSPISQLPSQPPYSPYGPTINQQQQIVDSTWQTQQLGFNLTSIGPITTPFKLVGDAAYQQYPSLDVIFSSDMTDLEPLIGPQQTFRGFLAKYPVQPATSFLKSQSGYSSAARRSPSGIYNSDNSVYKVHSQMDYFEKLRRCPVPAVILCVTSPKEMTKCQGMSKAFHAANLKPELGCKLARSSLECMQLVQSRDADLVVLDAADIYIAGLRFHLMPIVSEQLDAQDSKYYVVALARKDDTDTSLLELKGKRSCHTGFMKAAGWVMPIGFLLANQLIRSYGDCDSAHSAAEFFDKGCAPGILAATSSASNSSSIASAWTMRNMCDLCHGSASSFCARESSEPFYGDTGAMRCLVEGGGQVAFCKHTTVFENTGGSNQETWARNLIRSDFELLCRDGRRDVVENYKQCNLGTISSNAIVTRDDTPPDLIDAYANLFLYGQQYYGSKYSEEYTFKMFVSVRKSNHDLIFQDATQQLSRVPITKQNYRDYLSQDSSDFIRAMELVYC